nr:outer membrane protein transport protein [Mariniphaga anaerophila]
MKKIIALLTLAFVAPFFVQAQGLLDALRYSDLQVQGTARSGGMGNAFGALGGDFTSVSINPAGLGLYRSAELVFTPSFGKNQVETSYRNNSMTDSKYNFAFNNLSYVATLSTQNKSETGLVNVNFGIGFNRLKNFNSTSLAGADNMDRSYLDYMTGNANAGIMDEFYENLAWETYLLWKDDETSEYWHDLDENHSNYGQSQRKSISRDGYVNEYSFAVGLNFNHKLYIGASIGLLDVNFKESYELLEWDKQNKIDYFNEMQFNSHLETTGTGYNGKIGIIYKPINALRLGASLHTPTFYNLHDFFRTSMYANVADENGEMGNFEAKSRYSDYDYDLETPLKATLSAAYVIGKKGLISVDYEYADYGSASLRRGGNGYNFVNENNEIAEAYRGVGNLRIGGEFMATSNISLRAGFENYPSPYNTNAFGANQPNADSKLNVYAAGFGYRTGGFFFDVAYRYSVQNSFDLMYPEPPTDFYNMPEMVEFNSTKNNVMFTLGFKF